MNFLKFITKKIYLFIFSLFLSFGFITSSYAVDITIWDLSGRNGQDEFYDGGAGSIYRRQRLVKDR